MSADPDAPFARGLRAALAARDVTQQQCAARLGVTKSQMSTWCNGWNTPVLDHIIRLAFTLRMSIDELCGLAPICTTGHADLCAVYAQDGPGGVGWYWGQYAAFAEFWPACSPTAVGPFTLLKEARADMFRELGIT